MVLRVCFKCVLFVLLLLFKCVHNGLHIHHKIHKV